MKSLIALFFITFAIGALARDLRTWPAVDVDTLTDEDDYLQEVNPNGRSRAAGEGSAVFPDFVHPDETQQARHAAPVGANELEALVPEPRHSRKGGKEKGKGKDKGKDQGKGDKSKGQQGQTDKETESTAISDRGVDTEVLSPF